MTTAAADDDHEDDDDEPADGYDFTCVWVLNV